MKVVSTDALTKLIQLVKSAFIKADDVVSVTEIDTETPQEVTLATVAISGDYNDLSNKPTIPTVNNATFTIQKNGTTVNTFTANASSNVTANISVPTKTSDLTNDDGFITGISSTDVTTALGFTPYDATNPSGYTTNTGTVTSVNNVSPVNGNVTISIPTVDLTYSGSSHNAQSGVAVAMAIDSAISSVYKPGGSIAFASLPTLGSTNEGYVYNVTDAFTTTSNFVEGEGKSYPAGTNVVIIPEDVKYYSWGELLTLSSTPQVGDTTYKDYSYGSGEHLIQVYGAVDSVGANYAYIEELDETYYRTSNNDINSFIYKFDVLTGAFQPLLVSGTNIKTVNNESILGSGNISISSGSTYTAGSGININNNIISVTDPVLVNSNKGSISIASQFSVPNAYAAIQIGQSAEANDDGSIAIGRYAKASKGSLHIGNMYSIGTNSIGIYGSVYADYAIQIGYGNGVSPAENRDANTVKIANSNGNFEILSADGTVPVARYNVMTGADGTNAGTKGAVPAPTATDNTKFLKGDGTWATPTIANMQTTTNLVTSVSSSSTDTQYPSAKLFYDTVGDIETLINAL